MPLDRSKLLNRLLVLFDQAATRGYQAEIVDEKNYIYGLTKGTHRITFFDFPPFNDKPTRKLMHNKEQANRLLAKHGLPASGGTSHICLTSALLHAHNIGFPLVVKPTFGTLSLGAHFPITSWPQFCYAFYATKRYGLHTMVERFLCGNNHRITVVSGKVVAAVLRVPPHVVGDGKSAIAELIAQKNTDPRRKPIQVQDTTLHELIIDKRTRAFLKQQGWHLQSVPAANETVFLDNKVLLTRGGDVYDVTDTMHEKNKELFIKTAHVLQANIAGIDCLMADISRSWDQQETAIIDINGKPYIDMHHFPTSGTPRNVAAAMMPLLERLPSGHYD